MFWSSAISQKCTNSCFVSYKIQNSNLSPGESLGDYYFKFKNLNNRLSFLLVVFDLFHGTHVRLPVTCGTLASKWTTLHL
jgi:hypothetical protein